MNEAPKVRYDQPLVLSRRSMVAAFAAATATVVPDAVARATSVAPVMPAENPALMALGEEVDRKLIAYRTAAERLAVARSTARSLWPEAPAEIIVLDREDRVYYTGCYEREIDFEGEVVWPPERTEGGRLVGFPPRNILSAGPLKALLELAQDPDGFEEWERSEIGGRLKAAETYEAACDNAISSSGIEEAKVTEAHCADDLDLLMSEVRKHAPRTAVGVLIFARAVTAYEEAQKNSQFSHHRILGRELADAVLRVMEANAVT